MATTTMNSVLGPEAPGYDSGDPLTLIASIRNGLPWSAFVRALQYLGLSMESAAGALRLPARTIARRRDHRLDPSESERVFRLIRVGMRAEDVLGSIEKARAWLQSPNRALGGATPVSLLDTDIGVQSVEDVLGRIEHGVYS